MYQLHWDKPLKYKKTLKNNTIKGLFVNPSALNCTVQHTFLHKAILWIQKHDLPNSSFGTILDNMLLIEMVAIPRRHPKPVPDTCKNKRKNSCNCYYCSLYHKVYLMEQKKLFRLFIFSCQTSWWQQTYHRTCAMKKQQIQGLAYLHSKKRMPECQEGSQAFSACNSGWAQISQSLRKNCKKSFHTHNIEI